MPGQVLARLTAYYSIVAAHHTLGIQNQLETNAAEPFIGLGCFFFKRWICPEWVNSASVWSQNGHGWYRLASLLPILSIKSVQNVHA
jgi:hypothetical protein